MQAARLGEVEAATRSTNKSLQRLVNKLQVRPLAAWNGVIVGAVAPQSALPCLMWRITTAQSSLSTVQLGKIARSHEYAAAKDIQAVTVLLVCRFGQRTSMPLCATRLWTWCSQRTPPR